MGYTHYWTPSKNVNDANWSTFCASAESIFEIARASGITLGDAQGEHHPIVDYSAANMVAFNGAGDLAYESCVIERGGAWTFCKTAHQPYDRVVVALLCIGEHLGVLDATSDGDANDWADGLALARDVLPQVQLPAAIREG